MFATSFSSDSASADSESRSSDHDNGSEGLNGRQRRARFGREGGASAMAGGHAPPLERLFNSGELHRLQAADGSMLICLNSLLACVRNTKTR
jgi:hypothetical protein